MIASAKAGDPRATRALLDSVSATVYRFGRSFCHDPDDAEDVMQDVFTALVRSLDRFRGDASLSSWAYVVARRACARRRRPRPVSVVSLDARREAGNGAEVAAPGGDPADIAESDELRGVLEDAIRELPAAQRDVIMLRDVEGLSAREVGAELGIGERAVKSRLHRARLAVRARVTAYRGGAPVARRDPCPNTALLLSRFIEGDVAAADCAAAERHVATCPRCRDACATLRDTLSACRKWGDAPVPRTMRTRLRRAARAAAGASGGTAQRAARPRGRRARRPVAARQSRS